MKIIKKKKLNKSKSLTNVDFKNNIYSDPKSIKLKTKIILTMSLS